LLLRPDLRERCVLQRHVHTHRRWRRLHERRDMPAAGRRFVPHRDLRQRSVRILQQRCR